MAALVATRVGRREPVGSRFMQSFRFTIANANAADEFVVGGPSGTGLRWIDRIAGCVGIGTAVTTDMPVFKRNCASGTAGTEDTAADGGALSIEGAAGTYEVQVFGKF
jgi:hypothetical protein